MSVPIEAFPICQGQDPVGKTGTLGFEMETCGLDARKISQIHLKP